MHFVFSVGTEEICAAGQGVQKLEREGEQHISQLMTAGPTEILVEEWPDTLQTVGKTRKLTVRPGSFSLLLSSYTKLPLQCKSPKNLLKGLKRYHLLEGRASRKCILKFSDDN